MISSMTLEERLGPAGVRVDVVGRLRDDRRASRPSAAAPTFTRVASSAIAKGSGRGEHEVKELLQKFAQMRQMMVQLGASTGLMGKIPGFKQFSQMKKLANMDLNALMSAGGGLPEGLGGAGGGMPNMPAMPGIPTGNIPGLPKGYTPPGTKSLVGTQRANDKQKSRDKRKAEKAARKKNRR